MNMDTNQIINELQNAIKQLKKEIIEKENLITELIEQLDELNGTDK